MTNKNLDKQILSDHLSESVKNKIIANLSDIHHFSSNEKENLTTIISSSSEDNNNKTITAPLKRINSLVFDLINEGSFNSVWDIFESEFPSQERRFKTQHIAILQNKNYFLRGYKNSKGDIIGFISYWLFDNNQIYIEHFAIKKRVSILWLWF